MLHDVLENTHTPSGELEERFGRRVAELVRAVSEDDSIADRGERKAALREQVARGPLEAAAIFAADKVSRARVLASQLAAGLPEAEAARKLDHYRASLAMLQWRLGRRHRLVEQLRTELSVSERAARSAVQVAQSGRTRACQPSTRSTVPTHPRPSGSSR